MNPVHLQLWCFDNLRSIILDWSGFEALTPWDLFRGALLLDPVSQARGVELARNLALDPQNQARWRCLADWCAGQGLHDHAAEFGAIAALPTLIVTVAR